jgi:hypothetical protein
MFADYLARGLSKRQDSRCILPQSIFAGLNFTTLWAGMVMLCPVIGFLPFWAALSTTLKEPKPDRFTLSPFSMASVICVSTLSNACSACTFVIPPTPAIVATSSPLFILIRPFLLVIAISLQAACISSRFTGKNNRRIYLIFSRYFYLCPEK